VHLSTQVALSISNQIDGGVLIERSLVFIC